MRSELEQLEQIDQYLTGKMSPDQAAAFESQMQADPALKSLVHDQQLLIQTVTRKAMMAEINAIAGLAAGSGAAGGAASSASGWGALQWLITGLSIIGATIGGVYVYNEVNEDDPIQENPTVLAVNEEDNTEDFPDSISFGITAPVDSDQSYTDSSEDEESNDHHSVNTQNDVQIDHVKNGNKTKKDPLNNFSTIETKNKGENETAEVDETNKTIRIQKNRKASFPGGVLSMQDWFEKNLKYPGTAKKEKVQATVRVKFYVMETGQIEIIDSECISLKDENGKLLEGLKRTKHRKAIKYFKNNAETAFRICPNWLPATNTNGTAVTSEQVWYVKFNLYGKSEVYNFDSDTGFYDEDDQGCLEEVETEPVFEFNTAEDDFIIEPTNK